MKGLVHLFDKIWQALNSMQQDETTLDSKRADDVFLT